MLPYRSAMPGTKRSHTEAGGFAGPNEDEVHPSRRLKYTEADKEMAEIFRGLGDEIPSVRLEATRNLLNKLFAKSPDQSQRLGNAITRLIKGVCSGAKAARPGFSIALIEVLRLARKVDAKTTVVEVVDKAIALTNPEGRQSGEENRNYLIGRRFAFQAILQSDVLSGASEESAKYVFGAIAELAAHKDWLRSECGALLLEFIKTPEGTRMKDESARILIDSWAAKNLIKTPEGVALWLTVKTTFPGAKLPKGHWNHNNPLAAQDRPSLTKALLKTEVDADDQVKGAKKKSGTRQSIPNFAWAVILAHLYEQDREKEFAQFWEECVAKQMFSASSSTETKSLGLQIFTKALATAPVELLGKVTHQNIVRCILDQRVSAERLLFVAAKIPLDQMVTRTRKEPAAAAEIALQLLKVAPTKFDKVTRSTIDALLAAAVPSSLLPIVEAVNAQCLRLEDPSDASNRRRVLSDTLLVIVRSHRGDASQKWLKVLLRNLTNLGYKALDGEAAPSIDSDSQKLFRERLSSALGTLASLPLQDAAKAMRIVVDQLHSIRKHLVVDLDDAARNVLQDGRKQLKDAEEKTSADGGDAKVNQGFQLLISLGMLNVYKEEPESVGVLEDIITCYQSPKESGDAATMLVELLLSFVSKQSMLFRKLAGQVFAAFAPDITSEALQSMIDILSQKESLAGQQELFKQGDEDEEDEDDDVDMEDAEDASDVEITNGVVSGAQDSDDEASEDSSASSSASDDESEEGGEEDEETVFDRKLAEALGTAAADEDDDSDGSDMDDEQMMALEPHLTTIFAERKKGSSTKQDNASAKANIINFKNRVLDLLTVFVKSQSANSLVLDLLHPLCTLTRTTSSQPTAKKALEVLEALFTACKKNQTLPEIPDAAEASEDEEEDAEEGSETDDDVEGANSPLLTLLRAVHLEIMQGGSKVHASACSKTSMFLAKILIAQGPGRFSQVDQMYLELRKIWRESSSKIHPSIFNDWHNFSMQK